MARIKTMTAVPSNTNNLPKLQRPITLPGRRMELICGEKKKRMETTCSRSIQCTQQRHYYFIPMNTQNRNKSYRTVCTIKKIKTLSSKTQPLNKRCRAMACLLLTVKGKPLGLFPQRRVYRRALQNIPHWSARHFSGQPRNACLCESGRAKKPYSRRTL